MRQKGKSYTAPDGLRLCKTCRRYPDPVWMAVYTGQMTFEEALAAYPPIEDEEEEAS